MEGLGVVVWRRLCVLRCGFSFSGMIYTLGAIKKKHESCLSPIALQPSVDRRDPFDGRLRSGCGLSRRGL